jgi:hypothetical protein
MNSKVPSGFWVYSPVRSAAVVSPSPATVIRPGKAASISEFSRYRTARSPALPTPRPILKGR